MRRIVHYLWLPGLGAVACGGDVERAGLIDPVQTGSTPRPATLTEDGGESGSGGSSGGGSSGGPVDTGNPDTLGNPVGSETIVGPVDPASYPQFSDDGSKLAYAFDQNLIVLDIVSGERVPVGTATGQRFALSADGRYVAYASGENPTNNVIVAQSDGANPLAFPVTEADVLHVRLSDDGSVLAFNDREAIHVVTVADRTDIVVGDSTDPFSLSGDGKWISYFTPNNPKILFVVPTDGSEPPTQLTSYNNGARFHPMLSFDGSRIVMIVNREETGGMPALMTINRDGTDERIWVDGADLLESRGQSIGDEFDFEGDFIGYSVIALDARWDPQPGWGLRVLDIGSRSLHYLTTIQGFAPTISADGQRMAFINEGELYVIDLGG